MTAKPDVPVAQPIGIKGQLHPELRATSRILKIFSEFDERARFRILDHVRGILRADEDARIPPGTPDPRD